MSLRLRVRQWTSLVRSWPHLVLCGLLLSLPACSFFNRSTTFIAYQLPLNVVLRVDSSVSRAAVEYRDACGQPAAVALDRMLQETLKRKLDMVFQKVILSPSEGPTADGVVDVALGLKQLELLVLKKSDRSYPATMLLGLDFSYSDLDGTVRYSKKLQSQASADVEATRDSCAVMGLDRLAQEAIEKVVEGMAVQLGESPSIREAAQAKKSGGQVAAVSSAPAETSPRALPPAASSAAAVGEPPRAASSSTGAAKDPAGGGAGEARLSFRTILRDENRNLVLEQHEHFTVNFEITNQGTAVANEVEIDLNGHPAVIENLSRPVKVGRLAPGEIRRVSVEGVVGPVADLEQAELVCVLRAADPVTLPPAKKFLVAIKPGTDEEIEVLSVDVDQLPHKPLAFKQPDAIGIAIGIGQYRDPAVPGTQFAGRDAEVMSSYFKTFMGVPNQRIRLLQDDHVMKDDLVEVFEQWLPAHADPQTVALVYVSGRAVVEAATGAVSLVPFDGGGSAPNRLFSLARLQRALSRAPIQRAVLLLDLSLEPTPGTEAGEGLVPAWDGLKDGGGGTDQLLWIIGNRAVQEAHAYRRGQHGLFTYFLLKGIRGAADLDKNGTVLAGELCAYVRQRVEDVARHQFGNAQQPLCVAGGNQSARIQTLPVSRPR